MRQSEVFSSRWGLILAALGMAIGTGNIWRFPRIAAQNGGGSFLIPWLIFLFLWSIPLLIIEFAMGKHTRYGPIGAFGKIMGKRFTWMGAFVAFCSIAIMFYYSVVMGWCIKYFVTSLVGNKAILQSELFWQKFTQGYQPILFHFFAMSIGSYVIYRGVAQGIERANKVLIPSLLILLILAAIRALTLPGAVDGLNFFFKPEIGKLLEYRTWLEALSQSAWSTGAGWGLLLTYSVYMKEKEDIVLNSFIAGLGNNSASLLAGLVILPTIFAMLPLDQAMQAVNSGNTGLTFIWIPQVFAKMPLGGIFMTIFFLALTFAALSSLIAMIELGTRIFIDAGFTRHRAISIVGTMGFIFGLPSALNLNFFNNQDWVWGLGLIISGLFFTIAVLKYGAEKFRNELINAEGNDIPAGKWFNIIVKIVIPVEFVGLITWWSWQAITDYDPQGWWKPLHTFSLGTCLFQWGIALGLFILLNNWLYRKTIEKE
ncbi:MAG: sodium-dependent transporter [Calditrichaeota bacterium]|nr:MAG: sodium-dependent transporter [Calditrichota bacterium]